MVAIGSRLVLQWRGSPMRHEAQHNTATVGASGALLSQKLPCSNEALRNATIMGCFFWGGEMRTRDSAILKTDRAEKHIADLEEFFGRHRPFTYVFETNAKTGECATYAKRDEAVAAEAANIVADIVHNLRSSLDHAYWQIVSPHIQNEKEARRVQFPFCETAERLDQCLRERFAVRVSDRFYQAFVELKPFGGEGGNELLFLIHQLDNLDKHRFPIPTGDFKRLSSDTIRDQVEDFPRSFVDCAFGMNSRDVTWRRRPMSWTQRRKAGLLVRPVFERELDVPVDIIFAVGSRGEMRPLVPTLRAFVETTRATIDAIRDAAK